MQYDIGVVGLGVMGANISKNMANNGFNVTTFDFFDTVRQSREYELNEYNVNIADTVEDFVDSLVSPKIILLLVKSGDVTDQTIERLKPLLQAGDVLIDGGNETYTNTMRRNKMLTEVGVNFIGMGVSGGEEGALNGPALMPGGQKEAYDKVADIFNKIAARADDGKPTVAYIGPDGSGHYVKMVHNGIEYADMELISEAYYFMKYCMGMTNDEMSDVFASWNTGELNSYLIEITANILRFKNEDGDYVIDLILDKAGQKGTGKWTGIEALSLGVPLSLITDSVFMRCLSSLILERKAVSEVYDNSVLEMDDSEKPEMLESLRRALYLSKILAYQQGFRLLREASEEYGWNLQLGEIAMIWRKGCIIRAQFLDRINQAYANDPGLENLILDEYFEEIIKKYEVDLREVAIAAIRYRVPMSGFTSAISYYDGITKPRLSANMIQAQRDYFGAHTYERVDIEGIFHTDWIHEAK